MIAYTWVAVDARTGIVLADFPDLNITTNPKCVLGQYQTATAELPVPTAPEGWLRATLPGASCIVLLAQTVNGFGVQLGQPNPLWGAMITKRIRTVGDTVQLSMSTIEAYFDRRYVGDVTFANVDQNLIMQALVNSYVLDGAAGKPGIPITVAITGTSPTLSISYADSSDKTVYSVLTELMGRQAGPEFTVGWQHLANPERYVPVLYVSSRIGNPVPANLPSPAATFEVPGPLTIGEFTEDFSANAGATDVLAVSTASAGSRPQSSHHTSGDAIRPTFEYRFTPSTSIVDPATLDSHAASALAQLLNGATALALEADGEDAPKLGTDWGIGDDVGFVLGGTDAAGNDLAPAFPGGIKGVGRAIGWELGLTDTWTMTPIVVGVQIGA